MKIHKLSVEFLLFLALGGFSSFIALSGRTRPRFKVFVSCEDERYKHPLLPEEQHLVPLVWLYAGTLIVLPILLFVIDMILFVGFPKSGGVRQKDKIRTAFGDCCFSLSLYYCGIFFLMILCKLSQVIGGRPAPYFLAMCAPDCYNTTDGLYTNEATKRSYVTEDSCPEHELRADSLSSFPCTHAVLSFYSASFVTLFYSSRGTVSYSRLLQPTIAVLTTTLAFVTSLSRLNEFSNHLIDVVAGAGIGTAMASLQVFVNGRKNPEPRKLD